MGKKKKIIIISAVVLFIIIIILSIGKKKGWIGEKEKIKVATELVKRRNITEIVSANGKIQPEEDIKITPYISGEVVKLYVNEGDKVKKGDLLAEIDPKIYLSNYERMEAALNSQKASLASSEARLLQAKSQFAKEELSFNRNKKLWEQNVISKADFEAAKSAYQVAKAQVASAEQNVKAAKYTVSSSLASLKEAKENLTRTKIVSPSDGTVSKLNVEQGERVAGASQFSAGTEIMRIANLNEMEVNVEVNENDIVRVNLFDTCLIEVDAYLNRKFKGIVTEIATSANVTGVSADQITNFNVKIRVLKDSYSDLIVNSKFPPLRPGMSATVDIQTQKANNVITVPIQAVTTRADTTGKFKNKTKENESKEYNPDKNEEEEIKEYVFVYDNGIAKLQKVKTGIQDNMYIQILEGLTENQEVIVAPYRAVSKKLKNNDEVKKVDRKLLFTKK
ncbi:MAG: efflux RND transporter periplasmic adaptor subunit [Bacteroidales bacterium]|nr:efflux RND transporter periplasmic adaptor subunit [Bacteroidales bacterium]